MWRWAQRQNYLSRDIRTEAEHTSRAVEAPLVVGIINSNTYGNLLEHFRAKHPEYLPALVLAGFTGMRRSEIHNQVWSDINLAEGHLKVTKAKRGTPSRRLVPICPAAVEWLMLTQDRTDFVCANLAVDRIRHIARDVKNDAGTAKFPPLPENCFRHSFISHRVADGGNVAETSLVAGNSPDMVRKHYLELVTKTEGAAWFAIRPKQVGELINLRAASGGGGA
jgi:integrase